MEPDFRDKVRRMFLGVVKKNKYMKLPMLICMTVLLSFYYILRHFADNGKRYVSIGFALVFFMMSSSFAFPVMSDRGGFESAAETSVAVMGEAELAEAKGYAVSCEEAGAFEQGEEDRYTLDDILEENKEYQTNQLLREDVQERVERTFSEEDWRLVLINKQHPIPEDYEFELVTIKGNMQCDKRILDELLNMLQQAKDDGINLVIRSPYRDMSRQEYLFNRKIKAYMKNGFSYLEAYKTASQAVTVPGASEHQIGLAIDITSDNYVSLDEGFGETAAGKWLAENSWEHGFILRYPSGKEYITSIEYEPWHFRYVGKEAAAIIAEEGITLEEFVENYL